MAMTQQRAESVRAGARFFGELFLILAGFTLLSAIYLSFRADHTATQFGFSTGNSAFMAQVILIGGAFIACLFAGIGYTLSLLCAIYDRHDSAVHVVGNVPPSPPGHALINAPQEPSPAPSTPVEQLRTPTSNWTPAPTPRFAPTPQPQPTPKGATLREWLTRERHLR